MSKESLSDERLIALRDHLLKEEKSPVTIQKYLRDVRVFLNCAGDRDLNKE